MGRFSARLFGDLRGPVFALPVDQMCGHGQIGLHAFPPDVAVVGQADIGENRVFVQAQHAVRVGQHVGARCNAKVTSLRVDGIHFAVSPGFDPGNVVANGRDFPALKTCWRHQHREIGFATC